MNPFSPNPVSQYIEMEKKALGEAYGSHMMYVILIVLFVILLYVAYMYTAKKGATVTMDNTNASDIQMRAEVLKIDTGTVDPAESEGDKDAAVSSTIESSLSAMGF